MSNSKNYSLSFSNSNYLNNKKISNNVVKNRVISNLKKAEKMLSNEKFKKLQSDLIVNLKNNNTVVAHINDNKYKLDIIGGSIPENQPTVPKNDSIPKKPMNSVPSVQSETNSPILKEQSKSISTKEQTISGPSVQSETNRITPIENEITREESSKTITDPTIESDKLNHDEHSTEDSMYSSELKPTSTESSEFESTKTPSESSDEGSLTSSNQKEMVPEKEKEKKKSIFNHIKGFFGIKGGNLTGYSSDNDDSQTYFFDTNDSDEESILDHLKDKKYLNSLNVKELREISKKNELVLSKGGCNLKKDQLIKQLHKKFKNM